MTDGALTAARLTHIALLSSDLDKTIDFYTTHTPLEVVEEFSDKDGRSVWLSNPGQTATPFIIVFVAFNKDAGKQVGLLDEFGHIGIEVPDRAQIDAIAERARELGVLHWEPRDRGKHVGYVCALKDPDGNIVEFSHNQAVFEKLQQRWPNA